MIFKSDEDERTQISVWILCFPGKMWAPVDCEKSRMYIEIPRENPTQTIQKDTLKPLKIRQNPQV